MSEVQSTAVRKVAGTAFTAHALLDYEKYIDDSAAALMRALIERREQVDIAWWFQCFAMDVINRIAFSDSLGFLEHGKDVDGIMAATKHRFDHWGAWSACPGLEHIWWKGPFAKLRKGRTSPLGRVARQKMGKRTSSPLLPDTELDLLGKFLSGAVKHPGLVSNDVILGMVQSTIGAGADTTGATLGIVFYYLNHHAEVVGKLRQELFSAREAGNLSKPPLWIEVSRLTYLDAVLRETMRLYPVAQWGQDRVVPPEGAVLCGQYIPAQTVVGCHIDSIHRNFEVFGNDADDFNPNRWIAASEGQRARMNRAMLGFGSGKRMCLGMHIAWLELKKLVPLLVMHLDVGISMASHT